MKKFLRRISFRSPEDPKNKLMESISSHERGEGIEGEKEFRELRERIKKRKAALFQE